MSKGCVNPERNGYFDLRNSLEEAARCGSCYGRNTSSENNIKVLCVTLTAAGLCSLLDNGLEHQSLDWWRFYGALRHLQLSGQTVLYFLDVVEDKID